MTRAIWLPEVLTAAGCKVRTIDGWETRGRDLPIVKGVIWHHTATGTNWTDDRVAALLRDGRNDLPGPLSQLGLQRDGTYVVIASGRANHNGYGTWGNATIGIEAYNDGRGEPWPAEQLRAYDKGTAAILAHLAMNTSALLGHKESDPRRKIDPAGIDMNQARQRVAALITYRPPAPNPEGPFMALTDAEQTELLAKVRDLHADYAVKGKGVRQTIAEISRRTADLVTGKRPGKAT